MAAMASLLSFTACSEDASPLDNGQNPGEVTIDDGATFELALSNTGIGTRAARPMGSSAAANNVNKVKLVFYKDNQGTWELAPETFKILQVDGQDYQGSENVIDFTENGPVAGGQDNGVPGTEGVPGDRERIEERKKIKMDGIEAGAKYRIVAYGYNGTFPYGTPVEDGTTKGLFSTGDHSKVGYDLEEVFAGEAIANAAKKADKNGKVKFTGAPKVTITRQVAGILAYFKIPTHAYGEVVKTVKVKANDKSKGFKFPASLLADKTYFNGIDNNTAEEEDELITFDMSKCAANWNDGNPTGDYYTTNDNDNVDYVIDNPAALNLKGLAENYKAPKNLALKGNTFFGARYVLPYEKHVASQTLKVILYGGASGTEVLKTLKVTTNQVVVGGDRYNYDIRCNNFYSIGKKMAAGNTEGKPDPENPDPDPKPEPDPKPVIPDEPIDLGATDQITVEINDAWDVLHDMDVEEE